MEKVNRENIFSKYSWLKLNKQKHNIIMGDDLDAALATVLYLHLNPNAKLTGIYKEYSELYFSNNFYKSFDDLINSCNTIWLDLDINSINCKSVGHHIIRHNNTNSLSGFKNSCNLNELLNRSINNNFRQKYPLGTIHFLLWLYEKNIPNIKYAEQLLWLADSAFINSQSHRFRSNAENWIRNIFSIKSLEDSFSKSIETIDFEKEISALQNDMIQNGFSKGRGQVKSKHLNLTGFQCQPNKLPEDIINLLDYIKSKTSWTFNEEQINLNDLCKFSGKRNGMKLNNLIRNYQNLDNFLNTNNVFSYVFPFKYNINFTIFKF